MSSSKLTTEQQIDTLWALGGLSKRELAGRVWGGIQRNDLLNRGYELAYNFLLALFPLLLVMVVLLGVSASEGSRLLDDFLSYFQQVLPRDAFQLVVNFLNETTRNAGGGKLTFGLLLALYSASGGMTQLMSTLDAAYEVHEGRSWLKIHLISLGLTVGIAVLVITALVLVLAGSWALDTSAQAVGLSSAVVIAGRILQWTLAIFFVVVAFAVIFYVAPDVKEQHWYWITPGSVVGLLLWATASTGLRIYLHFFNTYSKTYGSLGAVIILMLWFYVTGLAFLIGGQINSTIEHAAAEHGYREAKAPGEKVPVSSEQRAA